MLSTEMKYFQWFVCHISIFVVLFCFVLQHNRLHTTPAQMSIIESLGPEDMFTSMAKGILQT